MLAVAAKTVCTCSIRLQLLLRDKRTRSSRMWSWRTGCGFKTQSNFSAFGSGFTIPISNPSNSRGLCVKPGQTRLRFRRSVGWKPQTQLELFHAPDTAEAHLRIKILRSSSRLEFRITESRSICIEEKGSICSGKVQTDKQIAIFIGSVICGCSVYATPF